MSIIIENKKFALSISDGGIAESLVYKETGEECLDTTEPYSVFSLTEERPYNNEIKLAYPNKKTEFKAVSVSREGDILTVGFELIHVSAKIRIIEKESYIAFRLEDFSVPHPECTFRYMVTPPVYELCLLRLPVKKRKSFGGWLNVEWDDSLAVAVIAGSPAERIDSEERKSYRLMYAEARRDTKLKGATAALFLPKGARARTSPEMSESIFWVETINPDNAHEHIKYAKKMGFRYMMIFYNSIFHCENMYKFIGDYDFLPSYKNGFDDLRAMLQEIRDAGITPGIHFLHTHIGIYSRYVAPYADHRLNLRKHFTLTKELSPTDDVVYVEENPEGSFIDCDRRVLKFDGELIKYKSYTTERPYKFEGCERGYLGTTPTEHKKWLIGGLLDISEYGAWSIHIDQNTSLQDEIAEKLKKIYDCGFGFVYFDGAEGTNAPYEYYVPLAQLRVYKKFGSEPVFAEGAAKAHFSWHMISGGNAFDVFPPKIFKAMINKYPVDEAPKAKWDFTRVDFGWWRFSADMETDMYEYGASRAAAWDCPVTIATDMEICKNHPRADDIFEVLSRWEDVKRRRLLTSDEKEALRSTDTEHILLVNEKGEYELCPYYKVENVAGENEKISAFLFERQNKAYAVIWHKLGEGDITLSLENALYEDSLGSPRDMKAVDGKITIRVDKRRYLSAPVTLKALEEALKNAEYKE